MGRASGAQITVIAWHKSAEGAPYASLGQRRRKKLTKRSRAGSLSHASFETASGEPSSQNFNWCLIFQIRLLSDLTAKEKALI
jgi:hypothetical protein